MLDEKNSIRAVQYLRMSTDHQRYSLTNQRAAIAEYAAKRGYGGRRTPTQIGGRAASH
jgi:DNA invertase Pin-like site-specific DNA recombinase